MNEEASERGGYPKGRMDEERGSSEVEEFQPLCFLGERKTHC
jgi:hypothetical protein